MVIYECIFLNSCFKWTQTQNTFVSSCGLLCWFYFHQWRRKNKLTFTTSSKKKKQNKLVLIHVWQDFFFSPRYQINWFDTREVNSTFLQWTFSSMYQDKCRLTCNAVSIFFFKKRKENNQRYKMFELKITTLFHIQTGKKYTNEKQNHIQLQKVRLKIVARVNLSGEKNRAQGNWRRLTKYTVEYFYRMCVFTLIAVVAEEAV